MQQHRHHHFRVARQRLGRFQGWQRRGHGRRWRYKQRRQDPRRQGVVFGFDGGWLLQAHLQGVITDHQAIALLQHALAPVTQRTLIDQAGIAAGVSQVKLGATQLDARMHPRNVFARVVQGQVIVRPSADGATDLGKPADHVTGHRLVAVAFDQQDQVHSGLL